MSSEESNAPTEKTPADVEQERKDAPNSNAAPEEANTTTPRATTSHESVEGRTWIGTSMSASGADKKSFSSENKGASPISHNHRVLRHPKEVINSF
jgi:hypothetical protein